MPESSINITIRRSQVITALAGLTSVLLILHGLGVYSTYGLGHPFAKGFVPLFNLDTECNIPTFFSTLLLLVASLLLYWIAYVVDQAGSKYVINWRILSVIFIYLAMDESAQIHELLIQPLRNAFHLGGVFYWSWVIAGLAGVSLLGAIYIRFVIDLPSQLRGKLLLAAALYLTGALVFEMVGGNYASLHGVANLPYQFLTTAEELLEILGLIVLIDALLKYLQSSQTSLVVSA